MSRPLDPGSTIVEGHSPSSQHTEVAALRTRVAQLEQELGEQKWMTAAIQAMAFGSAAVTGHEFLKELLRQLCTALNVRYAFVTEWAPGRTDRIRVVAGWCGDDEADPIEYDLSDTPCQKVLQDGEAFFPHGVRQLFPRDAFLVEFAIESYMGVPLMNGGGPPAGHLCIMDVRPFLFERSQGGAIMKVFAERAAAELERFRAEKALRRQEERFRTLYDDNPSMYFMLSPAGTVLSVNRFGAAQLGYTTDELVGQSVLGVFDPVDHQTVLAQLEQCTRNPRRTFEWEIQKLRRNGTRLWVHERARMIADTDGALTILIVCEDVTEHRKTTRLLSTLVRESPLPIVSLDPDAHITSWNTAATRLFGWTEHEVLGRELPYVQPGEEATADALWQAGTRGAVVGPIELRRQRKDGTLVDLLLWPVFVHDTPGQLSTAVGIYVDQSELKRAEAARLRSETRLNFVLSRSPAIIYTASASGDYDATFVSANITDRLGYEPYECTSIPRFWADRIHPDDAPEIFRNLPRLFEQSRLTHEYRFLNKRGEYRWLRDDLVLIRDSEGHPTEILGSWLDITERKQSEEALRTSEAYLHRFVADAPVGLVILGEDKRVICANKALCELTGYTEQEILGNTYELYTHPEDLRANLVLTDEFYRGIRSEYTYGKRYIRKSGEIIWVSIKATRVELPGRPGPLLLAAVQDITEQKLAAEEREQLSRDLHDNILQSLYAVGMQLEAGKMAMGKSPKQSKTHMTHAVDHLNHLMLEVRQYIALLTQRTAPKPDFGQALRLLVASLSATGQAAPELQIQGPVLSLVSPMQGEQLLNIAREALSNSMRHAQATRRSVRLSSTKRTIRLVIHDDGVGFSLRRRSRGHGLTNMAARAKNIRARLIFHSAPGKGTRVTVEVPVEKGTANA